MACGTANTTTPSGGSAATLSSVAVTPDQPTVAVNATKQFTATGTYSDATTQDISTAVTWSSSDVAVATLDETGLAMAITAGTATMTATSGDISGSTLLTVTATATTTAPTATLTSIQTHIFTPTCAVAGCHSSSSSSGELSLTGGESFGALVGVTSSQQPSLKRVTANDPSNSYLIKKLEGTEITGSRMPRGGAALTTEQIQTIKDWITGGAQDN